MKKMTMMLAGAVFAMAAQLFADPPSGEYLVDGLYYYYSGSGEEVSVAGYEGNPVNVEIPSLISLSYQESEQQDDTVRQRKSCRVTSIGFEAFRDCSMKSVSIPPSVTRLDSWAFGCCGRLASITLPSSVTSIGDAAFNWCTNLTHVTIPSGVTSISYATFWACKGLKSVTIPDSVSSIASSAFYSCYKLTDVTIPSGVKIIKDFTFYNCEGLRNVTIPSSVENIQEYAFAGCTSLKELTLPSNLKSMGARALYFSGITGIVIPPNVTSIGEETFGGCFALESAVIPSSVTQIGSYAFKNCAVRLDFKGKPPEITGDILCLGSDCIGYFKTDYVDAWMAEIVDGYWHDVEMHCEDEYTVHFDANRGDGSGDKYMSDIWMPRNYTFNLPLNKFTREGYTFDGWANSDISTMAEYEDGEAVKNLTEFDEKTLYAHWKGNKIKVIFDYGPFRDKFGPRTIEYTVGTAYHNFPIVTSTKWSVRGWYTQPDGGERLDGGDVLPFTKDDGKLFLQADYLGSEPDPGDDPNPGEEDPNALSIDTTSLPSAMELESYEAQLTCSGGTASYAWSVSDGGYLDSVEGCTFAEVGEAQGWYDDDGTWTCDLPFTFNYCGKGYDSVTVGDNGFVQFDMDGESKIAIDDNDLYSENDDQDIFVERDGDHVTFRWNRIVYSESENVVNCAITLHSNGVIRCSFGECHNTSHEVTLYDAALEDGCVTYDVEEDEDLVLTLGFFPDGLSLDADTGVISGTPNVAGYYEFEVNVSDDAGSACTKTLTLDVAANPNKKRDGSYSETIGGYTWYYNVKDGEATIARTNQWGDVTYAVYPSPTTNMVIPSSLGGCPVVGIGDFAFQNGYRTIKGAVTIPDSVETIGNYAFYVCTITNLSIGASLRIFDPSAFYHTRVSGIELSSSNTNLVLRDRVLYSGDLSKMLLVGKDVTTLTIPAEMESDIYGWAFEDCLFIESIVVEDGNTRYEVRNGMLYDTLYDCVVCAPRRSGAVTCDIPEGTRIIRAYAIEGANYQAVEFPEGLAAIEDNAFCGCDGITELTIPASVEYVGYEAFYGSGWWNEQVEAAEESSETTPIVCDGWLLGYWYGDDFDGTLVVPDGVKALADYAFDNGDLTEVVLPIGVDVINEYAFDCCDSLTAIRFNGDEPTRVGMSYWGGEGEQCWDFLTWTDSEAVCYVRKEAEGWTDDDGNLPEYWPLDPEDPENTEYARPLRYWTTCEPTMTIVRNAEGGDCRVALASETKGAVIRYTTDDSEPNGLSSVYNGEIAVSADTTIKAYATSAELPDSEVVAWEVSAQSELPLYWSAATNDGECPWFEMCQSTFCAMQSGNVGHDGISSFEIATNGALEISFSWMASSEQDYDKLVFYVDDEEVAYISGEREWEEFQYSVEENGEHVLRWSYEKDVSVDDGDDCGRLKGMVITVAEAYDPIPDIGDEPTGEEIYEALEGSADEMLAECITNAANYKAYREWAESVKGTNGSETAGAQAVKDSPNAWVSFALGSDRLLEAPPTDEDLKVEKFEPSSEAGKFDFTVSVEGVEVGSEALEENLKQVFGLEGAATLDPTAFASDNVDLTFGTPENGKVKFTAGPKDTQTETFFMKVKVK